MTSRGAQLCAFLVSLLVHGALSQTCAQVNYNVSNTAQLRAALLVDYDETHTPQPSPTAVYSLLALNNIWGIDTVSGAYWLDAESTHIWIDCRLAYDQQNDSEMAWVGWEPDQIWQPRFFDLEVRDTFDVRRSTTLVSLPDGVVYMNVPWVARYACTMDLTNIPYDVQTCTWEISTPNPSTNLQLAMWTNESQRVGYFGLEGYQGITNREWTFTNFTTKKVLRGDGAAFLTYDSFQLAFVIDRKAYWYTVNLILPAILMWVLSYGSLFITPDAAPARVALIVLPLLILITLTNRAFSFMPIISESTWLTDYLFVLTVLCSLHLFEYGVLHTAMRAKKRREALVKRADDAKPDPYLPPPVSEPGEPRPSLDVEQGPSEHVPLNGNDRYDGRGSARSSWTSSSSPQSSASSQARSGACGHVAPAPEPRSAKIKRECGHFADKCVDVGCRLDHITRVVSLLIMAIVTMVYYFTAGE